MPALTSPVTVVYSLPVNDIRTSADGSATSDVAKQHPLVLAALRSVLLDVFHCTAHLTGTHARVVHTVERCHVVPKAAATNNNILSGSKQQQQQQHPLYRVKFNASTTTTSAQPTDDTAHYILQHPHPAVVTVDTNNTLSTVMDLLVSTTSQLQVRQHTVIDQERYVMPAGSIISAVTLSTIRMGGAGSMMTTLYHTLTVGVEVSGCLSYEMVQGAAAEFMTQLLDLADLYVQSLPPSTTAAAPSTNDQAANNNRLTATDCKSTTTATLTKYRLPHQYTDRHTAVQYTELLKAAVASAAQLSAPSQQPRPVTDRASSGTMPRQPQTVVAAGA